MNSTAVGIALVLLVLFGSQIFAGIKAAWLFVSTRLPSVSSFTTVKVELPLWKVVALIVAFWFIAGGVSWQGCTLPALPAWNVFGPSTLSGMRVLVLDETAPTKPLTDEQSAAIRSLDVRTYLDAHTLADSQGGKGWRNEDPDAPFTNLPKEWQTIRANVKPTQYPWVAVADLNGRVVAEGPYPVPLASAMAFFKKYGG